MDGSAEHACFVLGVSLHYADNADTFSQRGHFFGAHTVQDCLQWTQCSAFLRHFAVTNQSLPLTGHFDSVVSSLAVHYLSHGRRRSLYGEVFDLSLAKIQNTFEMNSMPSRL